jgi:membrane associated rhomboid family serine protease
LVGPVSTRTPLLRFVDALTAGDGAPGLLVQVDPDRAAIALRPNGVLVVALDARDPQPLDVVLERAANALHAETPEVVAGLMPNFVTIVLVGGAMTLDGIIAAPQNVGGRRAHWIAIAPDGALTFDDRAIAGMARSVIRDVDKTIERAMGATTIDAGSEARALAERFGEQTLADESRFRGVALAPARRATIAIVVACTAMFLVQLLLTDKTEGSLLRVGALQGRWAMNGHPETLVSYAFLHGGVIHILMNMSALFSVGTVLESIIGARRTIVVFTASVIGGGIAIVLLKPDQLVVGASAGIFGVMTALYGLSLRGSDLPALARSRLRRSIGSTLVINLLISLLPNVSLLGHAGGALAGFLLGISGALTAGVALPWREAPSPEIAARANRIADIAVLVCVVVLVASVAVALFRGQATSIAVRDVPPSADPSTVAIV